MFGEARVERSTTVRRQCGLVARECADVGGALGDAIMSFAALRKGFAKLQRIMLEAQYRQSSFRDVVDEVRGSTEEASRRLQSGTEIVAGSIGFLGDVVVLIEDLASHIDAVSNAMEDVRRSSKSINQIAETTRMLALNASIEASRAGENRPVFGIVANEVKALAAQAHLAANDITSRTNHLLEEGDSLARRLANGNRASANARASIDNLQIVLAETDALVLRLADQSAALSNIHRQIDRQNADSDLALAEFDALAEDSAAGLEGAAAKTTTLELLACDMFDQIVKFGMAPSDRRIVDIALSATADIVQITGSALRDGQLTESVIFDQHYRMIEGSNPERFETPLKPWADRVWRPILDDVSLIDNRIIAAVCLDRNGYLPTHMSKTSLAPTGVQAHDTQFCRDGRRFDLPVNRKAFDCNDDYMMSVYRHEGDGREHRIVRSVYVPLRFCGKRWGSFQISYVDEHD